jgi:NitT/TauT family transport system substrate-binding protein
MRNRGVATLVLLALAWLCADARADEAVNLRLKWLNQAQFAGFYLAREKGFYKSEGLNVNVQPGGPDFPAVQMSQAATSSSASPAPIRF